MNSEAERRLVQRLIEESDITEPQALELIALLGANWSSLMREAKGIKHNLTSPALPPSRTLAPTANWLATRTGS